MTSSYLNQQQTNVHLVLSVRQNFLKMKHKANFKSNSGDGNKDSYNNNTVFSINSMIGVILISVVVLNFNTISNKVINLGKIWFQKTEQPETLQRDSLNWLAGDYLASIAKSGAPVRKLPSTLKGERIINLKEGDIVEYLGEKLVKDQSVLVNEKKVYGYWVKVRTSNGTEGWTFSGSYKRTNKPLSSATPLGKTVPTPSEKKQQDIYQGFPLNETYAVCNGNAVMYFLTPFGDPNSGTRLGHLNTGDRITLLERTLELEEMTRRGVTRMAYRYKFPFIDKNGIPGFAWIKGIWLDIEEQQTEEKYMAQPPPAYEDIEVSTISTTRPTLTFKQENKSIIAIYADKELGAIQGHYYSNIYTRDITGKLAIQVCTDENGEVIQSMFLSANSTIQEERFIKSIQELVDKFKFTNRNCGLIEVKIFQGN